MTKTMLNSALHTQALLRERPPDSIIALTSLEQ